jgi:hypothetical protein
MTSMATCLLKHVDPQKGTLQYYIVYISKYYIVIVVYDPHDFLAQDCYSDDSGDMCWWNHLDGEPAEQLGCNAKPVCLAGQIA